MSSYPYVRLEGEPTEPGWYYFVGVFGTPPWVGEWEGFTELFDTGDGMFCNETDYSTYEMRGQWWRVTTPVEAEVNQAWSEYEDEKDNLEVI